MSSIEEFVFAPVHIVEVRELPDGDTEQVAVTYACDFCLDSRVLWTYDCAAFTVPLAGFGSDDAWLACGHCSELIEAGDRTGLLARSEHSWVLRGNPAIPALMVNIDLIQGGFWKHRTGERVPFG